MALARCAKIIGWHRDTVRKWAIANDLFEHVGARRFISIARLKKAFPDTYADLSGEMTEEEIV